VTNYKLLTGPFAGSVVEEGQVLDVDWEDLDEDLQSRILEWAESEVKNFNPDTDDMNLVKQDYENSWDSEETDEDVDLKPLSEY
jgi:hypothetical protein